MPAADHTFAIGANYWPRLKGLYWWKDFSAAEVDAEFEEIASWGLGLVRIFLMWEDFQPAPEVITHLDDLGVVLNLAARHGLQVMPTFFTGNMSGGSWWPEWALGDQEDPGGQPRYAGGKPTQRVGRDPYTDSQLLHAQELQIRAICSRYGEHPAVAGWDMANEPNLFSTPRSAADAVAWCRRMTAAVRRLSLRPVTCGLDLSTLTTADAGVQWDAVAPLLSVPSLHAYSIFYPETEQAAPLCSDVVPLAALVGEALGGSPVLVQEFGYASTPTGGPSFYRWTRRGASYGLQYFADDDAGALYYTAVLDKLIACGARGAWAWCFSDFAPSLYGTPPYDDCEHERYFGLTRADGTLKPSGKALVDCAQAAQRGDLPLRRVPPLDLDAPSWYADPARHFSQLLATWRGRLPDALH